VGKLPKRNLQENPRERFEKFARNLQKDSGRGSGNGFERKGVVSI